MLRSCRSFISTQRFQVIFFHINPQGVALLNMVVQHGGQQIVGRANGVKVPGKMQVDVLHGHHLGIAAAGSPPPLSPNTGPREGSRRATTDFLPSFRRPSARPTVVVVFPSPAGGG